MHMDLGLGASGTCRTLLTRCSSDISELGSLMTLVPCEVGEVIYHHEERARFWYRVVSGAVRNCATMMGGRRQIVDFLLPEDVFGIGVHDRHRFTTEAISSGTVVARYPRRDAEQLAEADPRVGRWIREKAFLSISRLQVRTLILGHTSALARVSAFLLEWMDRCNRPTGTPIDLPMSRYDIADYLAMAVETVSRILTLLRTHEIIVFQSARRLSVCDRRALELATEGTEDQWIAN